MNKTELWIFAIIIVLALVVVFLGVQATGNVSRIYNVQYRSCHYLDSDMRGDCMRIERQESTKCDPAETIPEQLTGSYNPWNRPMQWFYRICSGPKGTTSW
ncbi:hypothetical protein HZA97_08760 [Candidatus Woesearchaeota archaeon]|nr:hypothetical protein [Candidatus Woesearchaeota archaeon]